MIAHHRSSLCLGSAFALAAGLLCATPALADRDGDGVADAMDQFPCDASLAAVSFSPAEGVHGVMLFEDQWPSKGDLDFNDVVLSYNYVHRLDGANRVVGMTATFNILALGGDFDNALQWHLPVPRGAVESITIQHEGQPLATPLTADTSEAELTVVLEPNLRSLFAGRAGPINAISSQPVLQSAAFEVEVRFLSSVALALNEAPYDLFVHRVLQRGLEIHRPEYSGTSQVDAGLFGTLHDRSVPGRRWVDDTGLPFVLELPTTAPYPEEGIAIDTLFPNIVQFAASGGQAAQDFYTVSVNGSAYGGMRPSPRLLSDWQAGLQACSFTSCGSFQAPDSAHCTGNSLGTLATNSYSDCFAYCEASGAQCCGFSDYGRHPNYSRPGQCRANDGPLGAGCSGCSIRITYAASCQAGPIACDAFTAPDSRHCGGTALGSLDTDDYDACRSYCTQLGAGCCGFSDYGRHANYSRPGRCTAYSGGVQPGCNGCTIRITYASPCQ